MKPWKNEQRTRRMILAAFAGFAALLLTSQVLMYSQWKSTEATVDLIENNVLTSVRLVGRMGFDVQRERILIDRHIFEHEAGRIAAVEAEIAAVRNDYDTAAHAYAPLATYEGEASGWMKLVEDVAAAERQTARALEASRDNRDLEATQRLIAAEPAFDAVAHDVTALIDLNRVVARRARARTAELHVHMLELQLGLSAAILLITLGVGLRLSRTVSRTERQLGQRTIDLEGKNRELDAFAGRVAHDLRGPLHTIDLAASMLAERVPEASATTAILRRGIAQMAKLLEELLGLSRAGTMTGAVARIEPIAASVAADMGPMVSGAGGTLRLEVEPASVQCSEGLLRQVLWNLGENAFKYRRTETPPAIAIVGRCTAEGYELKVSDNGLGISPQDARQVFEPFFRGEQTKAISGTGLGLAIVRRIVEASGGVVSVESQPGVGTTFSVRLPRAQRSDR